MVRPLFSVTLWAGADDGLSTNTNICVYVDWLTGWLTKGNRWSQDALELKIEKWNRFGFFWRLKYKMMDICACSSEMKGFASKREFDDRDACEPNQQFQKFNSWILDAKIVNIYTLVGNECACVCFGSKTFRSKINRNFTRSSLSTSQLTWTFCGIEREKQANALPLIFWLSTQPIPFRQKMFLSGNFLLLFEKLTSYWSRESYFLLFRIWILSNEKRLAREVI